MFIASNNVAATIFAFVPMLDCSCSSHVGSHGAGKGFEDRVKEQYHLVITGLVITGQVDLTVNQ